MQKSQFDELCDLRQIDVSQAILFQAKIGTPEL